MKNIEFLEVPLYEFGSGTRPEGREFGPTSAIAKNIQWSYSAKKAVLDFYSKPRQENETVDYYSAFSPDKTGKWNSLTSHFAAFKQDMSFFLGGMTYSMTRNGNVLNVKITDWYTKASGMTRDPSAYTSIKPYPITIHLKYHLKGK
jgi:hypothetical protein